MGGRRGGSGGRKSGALEEGRALPEGGTLLGRRAASFAADAPVKGLKLRGHQQEQQRVLVVQQLGGGGQLGARAGREPEVLDAMAEVRDAEVTMRARVAVGADALGEAKEI